jgi:hypothetical protein
MARITPAIKIQETRQTDTKPTEPPPAPNATNGTIQETRQTDTKPTEPPPAPNATNDTIQETRQTDTKPTEPPPAPNATNDTIQETGQSDTIPIEPPPALNATNGTIQETRQTDTKPIEPPPAPNATDGTIQETRQTETKPVEPPPAQDGATRQNSARVLAPTSARTPRKTTLPISAAHVRLVWSSNQAVTGNAYRTLGISSHDQCARLCRDDIRCKVTDYAKESETCRLFGSIERSDPSANSDYAVKAQ